MKRSFVENELCALRNHIINVDTINNTISDIRYDMIKYKRFSHHYDLLTDKLRFYKSLLDVLYCVDDKNPKVLSKISYDYDTNKCKYK